MTTRGFSAGVRLVLLLAVLTTARGQSGISAAERRRLADGLYARGMYALALEEYARLIEQTPPPADLDTLLYRAAESARHEGLAERAGALYRRALEADPRGKPARRARLRLADTAHRSGNHQAALERVRALLALEPDAGIDAPARYLHGQILEALGETAEAETVYKDLMRTYPDDVMSSYAALRLAKQDGDDRDFREKAYRQALRNPPSRDVEVEALWGLATLASRSGEREEAADMYWRLWRGHPDSARVRGGMLHIAWAQLRAERFEKALELSQETSLTRKAPAMDTWLYLDAAGHQRLGNEGEARLAYERLLTEYPDSRFRATAGYELASLHARAGEHEKVLAYSEQVMAIPGREVEGLWMLAESARAAGRTGPAIQYYTRIARRSGAHPRIADAMYLRALLLRELDADRAAEGLEEFATRFPKDDRAPEALRAAGAIRMERDAPDRALRLWRRALDGYPDLPGRTDLMYRTAMLEARLGENRAAMDRLAQLLDLELEPVRRAEANYWLGILLEREGKGEEAIGRLQAALDIGLEGEATTRARMRLGMLLQRRNRTEKALAMFRPLLAADSRDLLGDALLVWMLEALPGDAEPGFPMEVAAAMTAEARPDSVRELGFYARAKALLESGKPEEAVRAWERGLAFDSQSAEAAEAALNAGEARMELGRPDAALANFNAATRIASALELGRPQARGMMGTGDALAALEKWGGAARMYIGVGVLFDDPDLTPESLRKAAEAFEKAGMPEQAAETRDELEKRYPAAEPAGP